MASDKDFEQKISADPTGFLAGWSKAASGARSGAREITESVETSNKSLESLLGSMRSLGVLVTGGVFGEMVKQNFELQDSLSKSAQKAGVLTEAFSATAYAAKLADVDAAVLTKAYAKLGAALTNAQQGQKLDVELFNRLKMDPKNITDADALLTELAERFSNMENGAKKTSLAIDIFGKRIGPELIPLLNEGRDGLDELRKQAQDLGIVVSTDAGKAAEKFNDTIKMLGQAARGASLNMTNQLLPSLQAVANEMLAAKEVFSAVGTVFRVVFETVAVAGANLVYVVKTLIRDFGALEAGMVALAHLDFAGFSAISDAVKADDVKARQDIDALEKRILGLAGPEAGGGRGFVNPAKVRGKSEFEPGDKESTMTPKSKMGEFETQLAERKAAIERQGLLEGQYREMSKAAELTYWQDLKALRGLSAADRTAVNRKTAEAEMAGIKSNFQNKVAILQTEAAAYKNNTEERMRIELEIQAKYQQGTKEYEAAAKNIVTIQRQAADQERTIRDSRVQAEREARLQTLALEEQTVQTAAQLGTITHGQMLAEQLQFEVRRNAIAMEAVQQRLQTARLDPDKNPVEIEKLNREIEQLEEQHALRIGTIRGAMQIEGAKYQTQFFQGMQSSLQSQVAGILQGTLSLGAAFKNMFVSIGQTLAQTVAKMTADWIIGQVKMRVASQQTSLAQLNNNAAAAAGGAYNAIVGIPYVGPFLAPVAAAVAYAGVMAFGAMTSAEGGFDIPGNINPIVQTHAREMILPAKHADVIRSLADGGSAQQASAQSPVVLPPTMGADEFYITTRRQLVNAIKAAHRNAEFSGFQG